MIREPVVNGKFYPEDKDKLQDLIEQLKSKDSPRLSARGIIVPHAGYIYSGKVAIATVNKVLAKKTVVILGPNHTGYGENFGLWPKGKWKTPLGDAMINEQLAKKIIDSGSAIKADYLSHKFEHSIEVELPIFQYFFKQFDFVPIVCQTASLEKYRQVALQILSAIKDNKEDILLVASSDMTHYEPDQVARKKDSLAIESIINLDEEDLVKKVRKENISMCGVAPVAILLNCLKGLGANKAQVALYQTSADATGDCNSVVGYAGIVIN